VILFKQIVCLYFWYTIAFSSPWELLPFDLFDRSAEYLVAVIEWLQMGSRVFELELAKLETKVRTLTPSAPKLSQLTNLPRRLLPNDAECIDDLSLRLMLLVLSYGIDNGNMSMSRHIVQLQCHHWPHF
jgi:hypothetical protein